MLFCVWKILVPFLADLCVCGIWLPQAEVLFDICVVDTDAQSYLHHPPIRVLLYAEAEKNNKYANICATRCAHFTIQCFSIDGLVWSKAIYFMKRMACRLSTQWDKSFAKVLGWICDRLAFAILRASVLCIRGCCTKWRSLGLEDGAAIDLSWSPFCLLFLLCASFCCVIWFLIVCVYITLSFLLHIVCMSLCVLLCVTTNNSNTNIPVMRLPFTSVCLV